MPLLQYLDKKGSQRRIGRREIVATLDTLVHLTAGQAGEYGNAFPRWTVVVWDVADRAFNVDFPNYRIEFVESDSDAIQQPCERYEDAPQRDEHGRSRFIGGHESDQSSGHVVFRSGSTRAGVEAVSLGDST